MELAKKLLGAVLALVGAALVVVGVWFCAHLGTSGTATFAMTPTTAPVVLEPSVLNRLDEATTIRVVPSAGKQVWLGVGGPSDVRALVGTTPVDRAVSVKVRDWALVHHTRGAGTPVNPASSEIWRERHVGGSTLTVTLDQATAPQSVVVSGGVDRVEVSWTHRTWFVQAVVVAVVGLLVLLAGLATVFVRPRREPDPAENTESTQEARA